MSSPAAGELAPHRLDHRAGLDNLVLTGSLGLHSFSVLVSKVGAGRMLLILTTGWVQIFTVQAFSGLIEEMCCLIFFYVPLSS